MGWAYTWQYITHIITTGMVLEKTNLFYAPKWINKGILFNMQEIDSVGDFLHFLCTAATTLVLAFTKQEQLHELQSSVPMIVFTYSDI